jgi:hypothetical protein
MTRERLLVRRSSVRARLAQPTHDGGDATPRSAYPLAQNQYHNEVPQQHHRDLPSSRAVCHSSVLSNQYGWGCVKFGMKRPRTPEKYGHERNASRTRAPTSSCAAQGFRDGRRRLSRGFARQGQWTRYDSIRLPDRALAALVQSACNKPGSRQITHDHVRSGHGAWMAGPCRIPKLTVRVRFPSPAPHVKSVAAQANRTVSLKQVNAHSRPETAPVPLRVPLAIVASAP